MCLHPTCRYTKRISAEIVRIRRIKELQASIVTLYSPPTTPLHMSFLVAEDAAPRITAHHSAILSLLDFVTFITFTAVSAGCHSCCSRLLDTMSRLFVGLLGYLSLGYLLLRLLGLQTRGVGLLGTLLVAMAVGIGNYFSTVAYESVKPGRRVPRTSIFILADIYINLLV